ncbi:histone deacetylase complex protein [Pseudozyma hubeiensis SY62]|uniref:Histone deacetylase complex protein n=1 Tax=Pseudozyma hubeiensis (strain SY62) TaxID=1305764 RepID=R9PFS2_PSEHS|nr:histone deacetylase complex protein [Pseudozyma hubeiensis SY62]GAC96925.1 histone deacetylase complex protein [Pseudozyma hubeiensis SY62]
MAGRPPSPGDDATPFLLRVYVKPAPFRPLEHFHPDARPLRDEFKLYVWKTITLREVTHMLYDADPAVSSPLSLHAFRHVFWNDRLHEFDSRPVGVGITRVPLASITTLLSELDSEQGSMDVDQADGRHQVENETMAKQLGWDLLQDEIDEDAAGIVLSDLGLADGDLLDCVIKPDPSLAMAPKQPRATGRDRAADHFAPPRR